MDAGMRALSTFVRVLGLLGFGLILLSFDASVARAMGVPALAPIILSAGWLCVAAAVSHVARVVLFPQVDLQETMLEAIRDNNRGAGLVALGICIVLAALLMSQARV